MTAETIGTGQLYFDGKPLGEVVELELPALLPMPDPEGMLVEFVLRKHFEMRATIEGAMAAFLRRALLQMARRTMTKRGFRRWRAKVWRKRP